ncbi:MAG: hypothetical protein OEZ47_12575 [Gammaproteobacteria bacterium]|nr:hypothetical protein [Gammaproteobacteria bacterium]
MMKSRRGLFLLFSALIFVLALGGCSSDSSDSSDAAPTGKGTVQLSGVAKK